MEINLPQVANARIVGSKRHLLKGVGNTDTVSQPSSPLGKKKSQKAFHLC